MADTKVYFVEPIKGATCKVNADKVEGDQYFLYLTKVSPEKIEIVAIFPRENVASIVEIDSLSRK